MRAGFIKRRPTRAHEHGGIFTSGTRGPVDVNVGASLPTGNRGEFAPSVLASPATTEGRRAVLHNDLLVSPDFPDHQERGKCLVLCRRAVGKQIARAH